MNLLTVYLIGAAVWTPTVMILIASSPKTFTEWDGNAAKAAWATFASGIIFGALWPATVFVAAIEIYIRELAKKRGAA